MKRFWLVVAGLFLAGLACRDTGSGLTLTPDKLPEAQVGRPYSVTLTLSGNRTPVHYMGIDPAALPPGLEQYHTELGLDLEIGGIPTEAGEFKFAVAVGCKGTNVNGQTLAQEYVLVVK